MPEAPALRCSYCGASVNVGDRRCKFCRSDLATLRCSRCMAVCHVPASACSQCGADLALEAEPTPNDQTCPRCNTRSMALVHLSGHPVVECLGCTGVFVTHETLKRTTTRAEAERGVALVGSAGATQAKLPTHEPRYLPCPACSKLMTPRQFASGSGIIIDICKAHGAWFDRDELSSALHFVASGGLERARKRDMEDARAVAAMRSHDWSASPSQPFASSPVGAVETGVDIVLEALAALLD